VRVRFHLDENIPFAIAAALRRRSIDVTVTAEERFTGATDEEQLKFAFAQRRVFVTQDQDFLRLHRSGISHCGIVYWRQGSVTLGAMLNYLLFLHDLLEPEEMSDKLEFAQRLDSHFH
jgi:predicted nuclease of predicted toxin-antitoxin system